LQTSPPISPQYKGALAVVIATGPSITPETFELLERYVQPRVALFGMNNVYEDIALDVHVACDPSWWRTYGKAAKDSGRCGISYTWDWDSHLAFPHTEYVEGRWGPGLSVDPTYIHYGHSSSYQCLNLAVLYGAARILLVGFDMKYPPGQPRHYFQALSAVGGEYPEHLRKWSKFDGLLKQYDTIRGQQGLPPIINCTPGSAMTTFPMGDLHKELEQWTQTP
jgi:hypothetical protein